MTDSKIERGDSVHHVPSGEDWIVLDANENYVYPAGWPPSQAFVDDCRVTEKGKWLDWLDKRESAKPRSTQHRYKPTWD